LATSFGLLVLFGALFYMKSIPRKLGFFFAGLAVAGSIFVFTLSSDIVVKRLKDTTFETSLRDDLYGKVIEGIETNPWLGTGYGTFRQAFMAYKNPDLSEGNWDKAHNSYLELAMELGVPATAAIIGAFAWVGSICLLGLYRRRRRRIFSAVGLAATAQVAGHSLVDFSLQIPGFVACYALLMGMAWSQSWPSRNARR
jgi:O-antigen ligase